MAWRGRLYIQANNSYYNIHDQINTKGQIGGPSIWLHWGARLWLYIKHVRQSMPFFFSPEVTLVLFQRNYVFLDNVFLSSRCFVQHFMDWWFETFFDLKSRLCWVCKRAVTASRSEKIKSLSAGGLGWQVLRVSGRQDGGGSSSRNRRWMNGEGLS